MPFKFLEKGRYKLTVGKSFDGKIKKKTQKFFNVIHKTSSDFNIFGKEAKLERKNGNCQIEMRSSNKPNVLYDAHVNTKDEHNCILIYDEVAKTFTIELQSAEISLSDRNDTLVLPNNHTTRSPSVAKQPVLQTPPVPVKVSASSVPVKAPTPPVPVKLLTPSVPVKVSTPPAPVKLSTPPAPVKVPSPAPSLMLAAEDTSAGVDDFDFDISKDMDAILDSESESGSDTFEEISTPSILSRPQPIPTPSPLVNVSEASTHISSPSVPISLTLPNTPITSNSPVSQSSLNTASNKSTPKKRKLKMASVPIRHPDAISPTLSTTGTPTINTPINHVLHKTNSDEFEDRSRIKRLKVTNKNEEIIDEDSSSSSNEDSSSDSEMSSSSSETTDSSSGSGSESESGSSSDDSSDDEDLESLANDISMSLSRGGPSAPGSPQNDTPSVPPTFQSAPYNTSSLLHTPTSVRPPNVVNTAGAGPMSLRALFSKLNKLNILHIFILTVVYTNRG
ncbi:uncharacterized protein BX663DRAFT_495776 [Cokeromyces recurvatus]|uniref:uncharacterized protein n=1 Tax=Cokeromyces recurvatus TaxID=90255 RepID=UPI002220BC37|nr:uncharacterized protein BX663DRAFT_495776 [Cokeromyces recurvatus]KAI7907406.1 hypothetical protein BX663DRAFT_495776 [Cokeromyces recurvatus]